MRHNEETAEMIFERINRHRAALAPAADSLGAGPLPREEVVPAPFPARPSAGDPLPGPGRAPTGSVPLRVDEVLFESERIIQAPAEPAASQAPDTFPRSATMRLVLNHPGVAMGIGIPAAALLLRSPLSRRLLFLAWQVGARPGMQELIGLSSALDLAARPGQKKAP